jgi:hypothetical protein
MILNYPLIINFNKIRQHVKRLKETEAALPFEYDFGCIASQLGDSATLAALPPRRRSSLADHHVSAGGASQQPVPPVRAAVARVVQVEVGSCRDPRYP